MHFFPSSNVARVFTVTLAAFVLVCSVIPGGKAVFLKEKLAFGASALGAGAVAGLLAGSHFHNAYGSYYGGGYHHGSYGSYGKYYGGGYGSYYGAGYGGHYGGYGGHPGYGGYGYGW